MKRIESRDNPTFKSIAALRQPHRSQKTGLVYLEGSRLCKDALESGATAVYLLIGDSAAGQPAALDLIGLLTDKARILSLPDRLFKLLSDTRNPQGVALICQAPFLGAPPSPPDSRGLFLIAENIQDPGNLGAMIRTAAAFAFNAVLLTEGTVYPFADKVLRAAMGSCYHLPIYCMTDIGTIACWLQSAGRRPFLLAADPGAPTGLPGNLSLPAALVVGNEANGLTEKAKNLCTSRVAIAMPGRAVSLTAAAGAGRPSPHLMQ